MKWLTRIVTGKARTPMPPKPYTEKVNANVIIREQLKREQIANIDPERPHWRDPKFESREKVPFFDIFGFNRNWSWTMFKIVSGTMFALLFYHEAKIVANHSDGSLMRVNIGSVSSMPDYARDEVATEAELRAAGFAYVGTKNMDHIGEHDAKGKR